MKANPSPMAQSALFTSEGDGLSTTCGVVECERSWFVCSQMHDSETAHHQPRRANTHPLRRTAAGIHVHVVCVVPIDHTVAQYRGHSTLTLAPECITISREPGPWC